MSIRGGVESQPDWQQELNECEGKIELLRTNSSPQQTDRVRKSVSSALSALRELPSAPNSPDKVEALRNRCIALQTHLGILEGQCKDGNLFGIRAGGSFHASRIFGSSTKRSVQEACREIKEIMKGILTTIATDSVGDPRKKIKKEIGKIHDPSQMQIALACSAQGCLGSTCDQRIALLSQIRKIPSIENLDQSTAERLIKLIPEQERTPQNIALFVNTIRGMTIMQRDDFITDMEKILPPGNRVNILESLINYYANSNPRLEKIKWLLDQIKESYTGLHIAAENGETSLLKFLIKKGANPMIRTNLGITPYMIYQMRGETIPKVLADYPDVAGLQLKMAALIWGLNGNGSLEFGSEFKLTGSDENMHRPFCEAIGNLDSLPPPIKKAFSEAASQPSVLEIEASIRSGELVVIPTGFEGHRMYHVFYQDMMFVCNRGAGSKEGSLRCFRIDRKKITRDEIKNLLSMRDLKEEEALQYYHDQFPASLANGDSADEITFKFSSIEPKKQLVGNCDIASAKLAIRAALAAFAYKANGNALPPHVAEEVRATSKQATRELRDGSYKALEVKLGKLDPAVKERVLGYFTVKKQKFDGESPQAIASSDFKISGLNSQIESLRTNSSSSQTALARRAIDTLITELKRLPTDGLEPAKLFERYRELKGLLSTLKELSKDEKLFGAQAGGTFHISRLFRDSTTRKKVIDLSMEIERVMKESLILLATGSGLNLTKEQKEVIIAQFNSVSNEDQIKIALVCSTKGYELANWGLRLTLIQKAKENFSPEESQYQQASRLLALIPEEEQTIENMKLFLSAMRGMNVRERELFVLDVESIPLERRVEKISQIGDSALTSLLPQGSQTSENKRVILDAMRGMNLEKRSIFLNNIKNIPQEERVTYLKKILLLLKLSGVSDKKSWIFHIISTQKPELLAAAELADHINDWGLLERFLKEPGINVVDRNGFSPYLQLRRAGVPAHKLEFLSSEEEIYQGQLNQEFLRAGLIALAEGFNDRVEKALSFMKDGPEKIMLSRYKTYDSEDFRLHLDQDFGDDPFKDYINSIVSGQELLDSIAHKDYQKAIELIGEDIPQKNNILFWMTIAARFALSQREPQLIQNRLKEMEAAKAKITDPEIQQNLKTLLAESNEDPQVFYRKISELAFPNDNEVIKSLRNQILDQLRQIIGI